MTNAEKTQYAWDTETQEEVYIGNKEDWPSDANERQDWRGVVPLRKEATKAVHGDGSARYRCCNDSSCSSQVLVAQKNIQKWNFRRVDEPGKPPTCKHRGHYVGESSFHWKTTLEIKKLLEHKMKNKEKWLDRTIVEVEREVMRHFPVGKFGASLQPDLFVRFKDGDWLVIEVVYTHAPEKESHEAYDHARSACKKLGPRIIELHLTQCINGPIDDDKHADWVRTGGMEKALEFEAELKQRTERYENRKIKFEEKEKRRQDRAIKETITTCKRDFPHLKYLDPDEFRRGDELQKIEDFFLLAHKIHNEFDLLVIEHETDYGLDPTKMKTIEEVKSSFEEKREQKKSANERITKFKENYPNYSLPEDLGWKPESNDSFNKLLDQHESYAKQCIQYINETIKKMRDEDCHSDIIERIKEYDITSVETNLDKFKNDFTNYCKEVKNKFFIETKKKRIDQLQEKTGIEPTQLLDSNSEEVDIDMIEDWFEKADKHQKSCSKILNEKMEGDLPDSVKARLKHIKPNYNNQDVEQYAQVIDNEINRIMLDNKINTLQAETKIKMPAKIRGRIALLDVEPWFNRAIIYKDECERHREETLNEMEADEEHSEYQFDGVKEVPLDYIKMDSSMFLSRLRVAKNRKKTWTEVIGEQRRRRKDEPFNPFSPDAGKIARQRKESKRKPKHGPLTSLATKQKAAMEALRRRRNEGESHNPDKKSKEKAKEIKKPQSREDRLALLRAKSAAAEQEAKTAKAEREERKKKNLEKRKEEAEAKKLFEGRIDLKQIEQVVDSGEYCSISGIECLEDVRIKVSKNKFKLLFSEKKNRSNWVGYDVTVTKNDPEEKEFEISCPYLLHCDPIKNL